MGFSFQVGPAKRVWEDGVGLAEALEMVCPDVRARRGRYFCLREELSVSWWGLLQTYAEGRVGTNKIPTLLAVEAWAGAYVPCVTEPIQIQLPDGYEFKVASLPRLLAELAVLAQDSDLPTEWRQINRLRKRYAKQAQYDEDPHIQCYCHVAMSAQVALKRNQPLFLVK